MTIAAEPFRIVVSEPFLGVDTKNHVMILQTETFYNSNGHMAYSHNVVLDDRPTKEEAFKIMLKKNVYAVRVSSAKKMTFDGRETRDVLPPNDDLNAFLKEYDYSSK